MKTLVLTALLITRAALADEIVPEPTDPSSAQTEATAAPVAAPSLEPAKPDLTVHAPLFIASTTQLVYATEADPQVMGMAVDLHRRRGNALTIMVGGWIGGTALGLLGIQAASTCTVSWSGGSSSGCTQGPQMAYLGGAVAGISTLVGLLMFPKADDYYAVLNAWNSRHPNQPLSR